MIRDRVYHDMTNRGVTGWLVSALLTAFYVVLYFTAALTPWAQKLGLSSKWDLYGVLYTVAIVGGGLAVIRKYGHNRYQVLRTSVVMFVQVVFAFSIPQMLKAMHQQAVVLLLGLRLRWVGQHVWRALAAFERQVDGGLEVRED